MLGGDASVAFGAHVRAFGVTEKVFIANHATALVWECSVNVRHCVIHQVSWSCRRELAGDVNEVALLSVRTATGSSKETAPDHIFIFAATRHAGIFFNARVIDP